MVQDLFARLSWPQDFTQPSGPTGHVPGTPVEQSRWRSPSSQWAVRQVSWATLAEHLPSPNSTVELGSLRSLRGQVLGEECRCLCSSSKGMLSPPRRGQGLGGASQQQGYLESPAPSTPRPHLLSCLSPHLPALWVQKLCWALIPPGALHVGAAGLDPTDCLWGGPWGPVQSSRRSSSVTFVWCSAHSGTVGWP